jgi:inhibitor of cysteine peptidase
MNKDFSDSQFHTFIFSKEDNGKQVTVNRGDEIVIRLKANPTTGYDWHPLEPGTGILEESRDYQVASQMMGSPSQLQLRYRAVSAGQIRLVLQYCRTWEKDISPLETFSLDINIVV